MVSQRRIVEKFALRVRRFLECVIKAWTCFNNTVDGFEFPRSQRELIRAARAEATQVAFAKRLGVDRSCLSRYESEALGAPTSVLNHCLKFIAARAAASAAPVTDVQRALRYAQQVVIALEAATTDVSLMPNQRRAGRAAPRSTSSGSTGAAARRPSKSWPLRTA